MLGDGDALDENDWDPEFLAKELVPKYLDLCPTITIRQFFQKTWCYTDAYRQGLTGLMAAHAVKKLTSHRKVTKQIMMEVVMLVS
jgi:hypothetical protein